MGVATEILGTKVNLQVFQLWTSFGEVPEDGWRRMLLASSGKQEIYEGG
jgi:hypothetical protein